MGVWKLLLEVPAQWPDRSSKIEAKQFPHVPQPRPEEPPFQIYLHSFVVSSEGEWTVVQQGMNDASGMARRYHWHSASVRDFVSEPHTGIVGEHQGAGFGQGGRPG